MKLEKERIRLYRKYLTTNEIEKCAIKARFSLSTAMNLIRGLNVTRKNKDVIIKLDKALEVKFKESEKEISKFRKRKKMRKFKV